jgi:hypothetical protein
MRLFVAIIMTPHSGFWGMIELLWFAVAEFMFVFLLPECLFYMGFWVLAKFIFAK